MEISDLPALNATLNGLSAVCLTLGYVLIRRGDRVNHQRAMLSALGISALFLVSYVTYHANAGSRPFPGQGPVRTLYFIILISHIVLAALILPMALMTAARALRRPRPSGAVDAPDLDLRVDHRRGDLRDALPALLTAVFGLKSHNRPPEHGTAGPAELR
jgi:uncharacterized membrane protein YozB (DUF420 family)